MESKTESVFLKVAGLYLDLVERKGDEVYVGGRRERRLNSSKIIILAGVDLEKIMQVIYYNFLIYTKKTCTKSTLFSICCIISLSIVLFVFKASLFHFSYVCARIHLISVPSPVLFFVVKEPPSVFELPCYFPWQRLFYFKF